MIQRSRYLEQLTTAIGRSPITALLGPRQVGKTTLTRLLAEHRPGTFPVSQKITVCAITDVAGLADQMLS